MFIEITKPAFLNCIPSNGWNFTNNHQIDSTLVLLESDVLLILGEKFATLVKKALVMKAYLFNLSQLV